MVSPHNCAGSVQRWGKWLFWKKRIRTWGKGTEEARGGAWGDGQATGAQKAAEALQGILELEDWSSVWNTGCGSLRRGQQSTDGRPFGAVAPHAALTTGDSCQPLTFAERSWGGAPGSTRRGAHGKGSPGRPGFPGPSLSQASRGLGRAKQRLFPWPGHRDPTRALGVGAAGCALRTQGSHPIPSQGPLCQTSPWTPAWP